MTQTPWGPTGYVTYKRTYARDITKNKKEEWVDTVERCVEATNKQLHCNFTGAEMDEIEQRHHAVPQRNSCWSFFMAAWYSYC